MSEIKDWIKEQIDAGYTNEQIRDSLRQSGYSPELLDEVLEERSGGGSSWKIPAIIAIFLVIFSLSGYLAYSGVLDIPDGVLGFDWLGNNESSKVAKYNLTVNKEGEGSINPEEGTYTYEKGTEVTITATPTIDGWKFTKWTEDEFSADYTGTNQEVIVNMDSEKEITAHFEEDYEDKYSLSVSSVSGGSATDETGNLSYQEGAEVDILAEPKEGYNFSHWKSPAGSFENNNKANTTFTMPAQNITVTANFEEAYSLTVSSDTGGSATDQTDNSPYTEGTSVNIKASPNSGYIFSQWKAPVGSFDNSSSNNTEFTMPGQNVTITANFEEKPETYDLTINIQGEGSEVNFGEGTHSIKYGSEVSFKASSDKGWKFKEWTGYKQKSDKSISFDMPQENINITAVFEEENEESPGISNCEELQQIQNNLSREFKLTSDIDCSGTVNWNNGKGFEPIGDNDNEFTGVLLGQGHVITGLYIDRPGQSNVGLFGFNNGIIKNVGIVDANVTGDWWVGVLAGRNMMMDGFISGSYVTGKVSGKEFIGGLVGINQVDLYQSYSSCEVTGEDKVGGLVGKNTGNISHSYSTGEVTGDYVVGGLVGKNYLKVSDSFWDTEASGMEESDGGTGLTTSEMQTKSTFTEVGWDFEDTWYMKNYPDLQWNQ